LIEERAQTFYEDDEDGRFVKRFSEQTGYEFESADDIIDMFAGWQQWAEVYEELTQTSPWFKGLIDAVEGCNVSSHDFHAGNWGIRPSTGELILIDLGF
jgi:hypothetical protein